MNKRKILFGDTDYPVWSDKCPVYQLFDVLGKKWTLYILLLVQEDINTFGAIMRALPKINSKVLSDRLDLLMEKGLILRRVTSNKPLKISYVLTEKGDELALKLDTIAGWVLADYKRVG